MLTLLRISGFALIDEVELELGPGLTVLTGETGAGKSIIVEALALLRGGRSSSEVIRTGADEARVEALVEVPVASEVHPRLEADGRAVEDGLVVRRTVARVGRGRVHLGGSLASSADLASTVGALLDITSQHDQQSLTDPERQLGVLDAFAGVEPLLVEMADAHRVLAEDTAGLEAFDTDARTRSEREDLLRFQLQELEQADLKSGEDEALRAERERLRGAERFFAAAAGGEEALYSGERAVIGVMAAVARSLDPLAQLDPALRPLVERLRGAQAVVEDVAADLAKYASGMRADPERLGEVEERLFLIGRLGRKHGGSIAGVLERRAAMAAELAALSSFEDQLESRRAAVSAARARVAAAADALTDARRQAASDLAGRITRHLRDLGLGDARIEVLVETRDCGPRGANRVQFLFGPNPGEEPRPLARIASGGELSRVMLAVKLALARTDQVSTYVFDEVDAGVGGSTAEVIGQKLTKLSTDRQVITITHLPQIAVFADRHFRVVKDVERGRTVVHVELLSGPARLREVARMLGGNRPSTEATAHARDMLQKARGNGKTASRARAEHGPGAGE